MPKLLQAALLLLLAGAASAQNIADLGWLAGSWVDRKGEVETEEVWLPPRGGTMLMLNRAATPARTVAFEFARIAPLEDGRLAFIAQPGGGTAVAFPVTATGPGSVTFANPAHDFPNRIRYWREGDRLRAEVSGNDGKVASSWSFTRR